MSKALYLLENLIYWLVLGPHNLPVAIRGRSNQGAEQVAPGRVFKLYITTFFALVKKHLAPLGLHSQSSVGYGEPHLFPFMRF